MKTVGLTHFQQTFNVGAEVSSPEHIRSINPKEQKITLDNPSKEKIK